MKVEDVAAFLPSVPYPPSVPGFWGEVTSTINWCEEDYYATIFSAEIINTLTNSMFVILAVKGLWNCWKQEHDRAFWATFTGYAITGCGSIMFHSSLKYPMQLVDELAMIYTTCFSCFASFTYLRSRTVTMLIALGLFSLAVFITGYYHYIQDPKFHQRAYALLTATVLFRGMYIMETHLRPGNVTRRRWIENSLEKKVDGISATEMKRMDDRDRRILSTMWSMIFYGLSVFLLGFAIWNLDNRYCSNLRRWRHVLGMPWGFVLEGHGWWHVMTGVGAYFYIQWGIWLRHCLNGKHDQYRLRWPRLITSLPVVEKLSNVKPARALNGKAKKEL